VLQPAEIAIGVAAALGEVGGDEAVPGGHAQQGDVAAFETIYKTHSPAVYALCRRMAGDEREARDLVQDVFVRAWEKLTLFRGQSALGTWLHRLAANVVLEHFRDEVGSIRVVLHAPFGGRVNAPWGMALGRRMRERLNVDVQIQTTDDGLMVRLPDMGAVPPLDAIRSLSVKSRIDLIFGLRVVR